MRCRVDNGTRAFPIPVTVYPRDAANMRPDQFLAPKRRLSFVIDFSPRSTSFSAQVMRLPSGPTSISLTKAD
jgi:hypothetical protein